MKRALLFVIAIIEVLFLSMPVAFGQQQRKPAHVPKGQLHCSISPTQPMVIFGDGLLWRKTTGLDISTGLEVRNRSEADALLRYFRLTPEGHWSSISSQYEPFNRSNPDGGNRFVAGEISIYFPLCVVGHNAQWFAQPTYEPRDMQDDELWKLEDGLMLSMRPGYGRRFLAFINALARHARAHDSGVVYRDMTASS